MTGKTFYLKGKELNNLLTSLRHNLPTDDDPYLAKLPKDEIRFVKVGALYHRYLYYVDTGNDLEASRIRQEIQSVAPEFLSKVN